MASITMATIDRFRRGSHLTACDGKVACKPAPALRKNFSEGFSMRCRATVAAAIAALLGFGSAARAAVTVCNEDSATIHVAFANHVNGSYTTAGWWSVPLNACQDVDFTPQGDTLYFTADSDDYVNNGRTVTTHWGNQVQLFVSSNRSSKFNYTNADKSRNGARRETFQPDALPGPPAKLVGIIVHIKTVGSSVTFTTKQ
jgi:uncharacterized membrane protein